MEPLPLMHMRLQNFGAVGSSFVDAGDRALLLDIKKELLATELKDQKKQMAKGKPSGPPSSGNTIMLLACQ